MNEHHVPVNFVPDVLTLVTLKLRDDYQIPAVIDLRAALRAHRRVLLQLPTGGGKTAIASYITKETVARKKRVYFICHRIELVEQTSLTWRKYGIPHGFIIADRHSCDALANVCSIDTLKRRLLTTPEPDIAIWDECHHLGAAGWQAVMQQWQTARHIGLTATPWRLDGSGLGRQFGAMVQGPTPTWLIEHGYLSQYEIYAPDPPDMRGTRRGADGDYAKVEASSRMNMPKRVGDILEHWGRLANGMRTVAFAVNLADSKVIVERFNAAGIPAAHLDGETPKTERKAIIRDYAAGGLLVLSNVALFGEGFDLSAIAQTDVTIDCLIDAAPSRSLSAVMQRWGRVLRPKPYPAVILDHAGNSNVHNFPDDEREWSLSDRPRTGKGGKSDEPAGPPPPYTCVCFRQIRRPLPTHCPHCKALLVPKERAVTEGEGELQKRTEADRRAIRVRQRDEERAATTLHELVDLARRRGYRNPQQWAFKKWSNSKWRKRLADKRTQQKGHK